MSDDAATERAIFRRACAVLSELQDDLAWSDVLPKFKGQAKRWQNSLDQTARRGKCLRASLLTPVTRAVPCRLTPAPCLAASLRRRALTPHSGAVRPPLRSYH